MSSEMTPREAWDKLGFHLQGLYRANNLTLAIESGAMRTCLNCDNFTNEFCMIAANGPAKPPAKIIVFGCDAHSSEIPF